MATYNDTKFQDHNFENDWVMAVLKFWPLRLGSRWRLRSKWRSDLHREWQDLLAYKILSVLSSKMNVLWLFLIVDLREWGQGGGWGQNHGHIIILSHLEWLDILTYNILVLCQKDEIFPSSSKKQTLFALVRGKQTQSALELGFNMLSINGGKSLYRLDFYLCWFQPSKTSFASTAKPNLMPKRKINITEPQLLLLLL